MCRCPPRSRPSSTNPGKLVRSMKINLQKNTPDVAAISRSSARYRLPSCDYPRFNARSCGKMLGPYSPPTWLGTM